MTLDRDSTVPLYIQLKEHLRTQIEQGRYATGARIPSERELAQTFHVSRMTARQALQLLATDGLITSRVGKGTFVLKPRINQDLLLLTSFTEDIRQRGMVAHSRVVAAAIEPADQEVAASLKISEAADVAYLSRVRMADEEPIAWEKCSLNARLCPGILDHHDFSRDSLYQALREEYRLRLLWADQWISARMPSREERDALDLGAKTPVLALTRVTYTDHDQPVEYVRSVYRCDRFQLRTVLQYGNG